MAHLNCGVFPECSRVATAIMNRICESSITETCRMKQSSSSWRRVFAIPEVGILIPLLGFGLLFYLIKPSTLSPASIGAMLRVMSFVGVVAVGMTLLMLAGEIDLSVGSVAGLCAIVCAWL